MKKIFLIPLMIMVVGGLILSGSVGPSEGASIKIGIIFPLVGPLAKDGKKMVTAAQFAFEQAGNEVAGKKIEVIVEDTGGRPDIALDKARKLVEHDKVAVIIGPLQHAPKLAVSSFMLKKGVPLILSSPSPLEITGHKWSFMSGGSATQQPYRMGIYAYDKIGLRKVNMMAPDMGEGHVMLDAFKEAFKSRGGKVVQEQYPPFMTPDFASYLSVLKDADAVVAWFPGMDGVRFLTQTHEMGIRKRMPVVAAFHGGFFAPWLLNEMPPPVADAVQGEFTVAPYTPLLDTAANKRFVDAFTKKYSYTPGVPEADAYVGAKIVLEALKSTKGESSPEKLRKALLAGDFEALEGNIRFDPETRFTIKNIYIVKVEKRGREYVWVPVHTYKNVPPLGH